MKFSGGDRVVWDHALGALHGSGSVLKRAALPATSVVGTVVETANEAGTLFVVAVDAEYGEHPAVLGASETHPDAGVLTLTGEELVKIEEEAE